MKPSPWACGMSICGKTDQQLMEVSGRAEERAKETLEQGLGGLKFHRRGNI